MNADAVLGANKDMIGYNLYAYCSNNPIFNCDTSGEFALGLGLALKVTCAVVAAIVVSKAVKKVTSAAVGVVSNVISSLKALSTTKTKAKSENNTKSGNNHNVYVLRNRVTEKAEYVGRTKDRDATTYRHRHNLYRKELEIDFVAKDISWETARGLEQKLIEECQTLIPNKANPMNNQINGLSAKHQFFDLYWDSAVTWLSENEVSCFVRSDKLK